MVKIRLNRIGSKANPHYRVVVVDSRKKRSGDYIESLGFYDPRGTTEQPLKIDAERAAYWLAQGAQPTDTAVRLLEQVGVEVGAVKVKRGKDYQARSATAPSEQARSAGAPSEQARSAGAPSEQARSAGAASESAEA